MRLNSFLALTCISATALPAQTPSDWNAPAALQLAERMWARREQPRGDTALRNYAAKATGFVYQMLDPSQPDAEPSVIAVHQVALELYWAAPNSSKQRVVGSRIGGSLPDWLARIHLDHLLIVQNGYSDIISMSGGEEVKDVPHPASARSAGVYDYRIADSLNLTFEGQPPLHVYELQVKPRDFEQPAIIGSLFIDRASADVVRMTFTFTPSSYIDRRLDEISVSVDNGLWNGKYWLPNDQYVELRRHTPYLETLGSSVLRSRLRVTGYRFNQELPAAVFVGDTIEVLPKEARAAFPFEEPIYAELDREGLEPPRRIENLQKLAREIVQKRALSGTPRLRFFVPSYSSMFRQNRAEGTVTQLGLAYVPDAAFRYETTIGYAIGLGSWSGSLAVRHESASRRLSLRAFSNETRDIGWRAGMPAYLNGFGRRSNDYSDPYYATGIGLDWHTPSNATWQLSVHATTELHDNIASAPLDSVSNGKETRPLRPIDRGSNIALETALEGTLWSSDPFRLVTRVNTELAAFDGTPYLRTIGSAELVAQSAAHSRKASVRMNVGFVTSRAPGQKLFLLGGRGTLPGTEYRSMTGDRVWLLEAEAVQMLYRRWIAVRATGAVGGVHEPAVLPGIDWPASARHGASLGAGVGLLNDVLRIEWFKRGTVPAHWQVSLKPSLWRFL